ncbi:MAG: IclR family transcriptional regulator [Acidimicrobiales bacterium]
MSRNMEQVQVSAVKRTGSQAIDRAAQLLCRVVDSPESVTFTELAASSGLAKSTTSRILLALERNGLVRREVGGAFRPGEAFVRYALRSNNESELVDLARPFLQRLGELTHETVNLGVVHNSMVEQIAQVDSRFVLGGTNWLGRCEPLHCTALGKALLACGAAALPPGRLARLSPKTITRRSVLEAELEEVRRRGYAVTDEELERGLVAVAAPVFRDRRLAIAAISVTAPSTRLGPSALAEVAAQCVAEAKALSELLGYRQQREGAA